MNFQDGKKPEYFSITTIQTSTLVRWVAFKAYIRDEIINYAKCKSKLYFEQLNALEQQIKEFEQQLYHN